MSFLIGVLCGAALAGAGGTWAWRRRREQWGRMLAFAVHELNTPITSINMTVLNFLSGVFGRIPDEHAPWMELLRAQTTRVGGIAGELRDFIHLDIIGDLMISGEEVSVEQTVGGVLEAVRHRVTSAAFEVRSEIAPGLPLVRWDGDRLARTLMSLLFHARKFSTGGPVMLSARPAGGRVDVSISYHGHPLAPGELAKSLSLHYPARPRGNQILSAVGLGLGLLQALARMQGGELAAAETADGSTVLTLRVPVAAAKTHAPAA